MDKATAISKAEQYANEVVKIFSPQAIVLYGSYAKGDFTPDSDIDVAVIFNDFTGDFLKASSQLWKLRRNISDDIEPVLLDLARDKSGFAREVFKTGQIIFGS